MNQMRRSKGAFLTIILVFTLVGINVKAQNGADRVTRQPSVTSLSQGGQAITAGSIGTLNQVLPTLVRGPLLNTFKEKFTDGARIRQRLIRSGLSKQDGIAVINEADAWSTQTYDWLQTYVSAYAAERFKFRTNLDLNYDWPEASDQPQLATVRSFLINTLSGELQNLDLLMREPSLYPEQSADGSIQK